MANTNNTNTNIKNYVLNRYTTSYWMYYDKKNNTFFFYDTEMDGPALKHWVPLPFEEDCKNSAWKIFYESLSEDDMALVESYDGEGGFFAFMRTNHLIDIYNDAWESACEQEFIAWEELYGLNIDWATATYRLF